MRTSVLRWPALLCLAAMSHIVLAAPVRAQQRAPATDAPPKDLVAVMEFLMINGTPGQGAALTNQLRVEVLRTGKVTLVDRSQLDEVLKEQALQQSGCTSSECAVEVGKILGIRHIVSGTVTQVSDDFWQVTAQITDVETSETLKAESLNHKGKFEELVFTGMAQLAKLLYPPSLAEVNAQLPPAGAGQAEVAQDSGISWWWWALGALALVGLAAASGGGGGGDNNDDEAGTVGFSY